MQNAAIRFPLCRAVTTVAKQRCRDAASSPKFHGWPGPPGQPCLPGDSAQNAAPDSLPSSRLPPPDPTSQTLPSSTSPFAACRISRLECRCRRRIAAGRNGHKASHAASWIHPPVPQPFPPTTSRQGWQLVPAQLLAKGRQGQRHIGRASTPALGTP